MSARGDALVGLVLAAGASRRMGPDRNKLLEEVDGRPVVATVASALVEAGLEQVVVVVGYEAERVREALAGVATEFVHNEAWEQGMGTSLAAGAASLMSGGTEHLGGVLVTVGDLPGLRAAHVRAVVDGAPFGPTSIRVPTHAGHDGHPVVFGAAHLAALAALDADRGARSILEANPQDVERVAVGGDGILRDVDTPDALEEARRR